MAAALIKADRAVVSWDAQKKAWRVRIQVGEEIIKRPCDSKVRRDATDEALRTLALETARADGYELQAGSVAIER